MKIPQIIIKFLSNDTFDITKEELEYVEEWIENPENEQIFSDYIKINAAIEKEIKTYDTQKAERRIIQHIEENKNVSFRRKVKTVLKYVAAASVLLIVALTIFLNKGSESHFNEPTIVNNNIQIGTDKATLTLENGKEITLMKGTFFQTPNATSNGEEIVYKKEASKGITFNYLTIPRGGQYYIILADGTKVWLNSESQLKYPVAFIEGETRQVELVYGEAYFDVSPSTAHKGSKFKVFNNAQEVEVLGTEFNIKAYKGEANIYTTLIEGQVEVTTQNGKEILAPNQQSNVNLSNQNITVSIANIYDEVSWKKGIFSFNGKSLEEIMRVLSRWHNMEVEFTNNDMKDEEFVGVLGRTQNIEEVLSIIKNFGVIKNYKINNKKVILK